MKKPTRRMTLYSENWTVFIHPPSICQKTGCNAKATYVIGHWQYFVCGTHARELNDWKIYPLSCDALIATSI